MMIQEYTTQVSICQSARDGFAANGRAKKYSGDFSPEYWYDQLLPVWGTGADINMILNGDHRSLDRSLDPVEFFCGTSEQDHTASGSNPDSAFPRLYRDLSARLEIKDCCLRIFQRYVEIQSPKLIALELNERGIKTRQGKKWDMPHIQR